MSTIVAIFNNCCNVSPRSAVRETAYGFADPWRPMASQASLEAYKRLSYSTFARDTMT